MESIIQDTIDRTPRVLEQAGNSLPQDFPVEVFDRIAAGVQDMANKLKEMPAELKSA